LVHAWYFLEGTDGATVSPRAAKAFGGEQFGHYELFRRLGMGGMAEVFLASPAPRSASRPVALKRMLPHFAQDGTFISRFRREVMLSLQLHHPAIAQVLEVGRVGRTWFMAMELVAGETLERIFDEERARERRMPASIVRRVGADIAMALDYAHKLVTPGGRPLHIIHRDVSPQNVMISYDGQVKLIDFGVARWADSGPRTGSLAGKVGYFSPEQARGLPIDHRSDVFSLGVMLYEALVGHPLFRCDNEVATMHAIVEETPPPLDGVPADLAAALRRATNKDPRHRFRDAREFAMALSGEATGSSRLGAGPEDLIAYMAELFPVGAIRWKHLLATPAARFPFESTLDGEPDAELDCWRETAPVEGLSDRYLRTRPSTPTFWSLTRKTTRVHRPAAREPARPGSTRTSPSARPLATSATSRAASRRTMAVVGSIATMALFIAIFAAATRSRDKQSPDLCPGAQGSLQTSRASALSLGIGPFTVAPMVPALRRATGVMGRRPAAGREEDSPLGRAAAARARPVR
jgi:serine/threonine protein kinase